jgi:hypothetical protein
MKIATTEQAREQLRVAYKGKRVRCLEMPLPRDPHPVPVGTEGICWDVDGIGQLLMKWDNGSTLNLIPGVDKFEVIEKSRELVSLYQEKHGSMAGKWFIHYAYYIQGKFTGETESVYLSDEQLYQAFKPLLKYVDRGAE